MSARIDRSSLSINILAYENEDCVGRILSSLLMADSNQASVIVSDNSFSSTAVESVVRSYQAQFSDRLRYRRNSASVGAIGNILKAFELVDTDYVWIVGACNEFVPASVNKVFSVLQNQDPDCLMIYEDNLWRTNIVKESRTYSDMESVLRDHSYSVLCSINSLIYKVAIFRNYLDIAYEAGSSLVPHTAMVLEGLRRNELKILYVPLHAIVRPSRTREWSTRKFIRNLTSIFPGYVPEIEQKKFLTIISETDTWIHSEIKRLNDDPNYGYALNRSR